MEVIMKFKVLADKEGNFQVREYKENFEIVCSYCNKPDTYNVNEDMDLFCGGCGGLLVIKGKGRTCFDLTDITKLKNIIKMSRSTEDRRNALVLLGRALEWCEDLTLCEFLLQLSINEPDKWMRKKAESILSQQRVTGSARLKQEINLFRNVPIKPPSLISRQPAKDKMIDSIKKPQNCLMDIKRGKLEEDGKIVLKKKEKSFSELLEELEEETLVTPKDDTLYGIKKEVEEKTIDLPEKEEQYLYEPQKEYEEDTISAPAYESKGSSSLEQKEKSLYELQKEYDEETLVASEYETRPFPPVEQEEKTLYELQKEYDEETETAPEARQIYKPQKEFKKETVPFPIDKSKESTQEKSLYEMQKEFEEELYSHEEAIEDKEYKTVAPSVEKEIKKKRSGLADILLEAIEDEETEDYITSEEDEIIDEEETVPEDVESEDYITSEERDVIKDVESEDYIPSEERGITEDEETEDYIPSEEDEIIDEEETVPEDVESEDYIPSEERDVIEDVESEDYIPSEERDVIEDEELILADLLNEIPLNTNTAFVESDIDEDLMELLDSAVESIEATKEKIKRSSIFTPSLPENRETEVSDEEPEVLDEEPEEILETEKTGDLTEKEEEQIITKEKIEEVYFPIFPSRFDLLEDEEEETASARVRKEINKLEEELGEVVIFEKEVPRPPVTEPFQTEEKESPETFEPLAESEEERIFQDLLGGVTLESLIEQFLLEESGAIKYDILFVIGEMRSNEATDFLGELLLKDPDKGIRINALEGLEKIGDRRCLPVLGKVIKKEKSKKIRKRAAQLYSLLKHNINRRALLSQE